MIAADLVKAYLARRPVAEICDTGWFTDWEQIRRYIMFRLVNTERNAKMLEDVPHLDVPELGLSMTCYIVLQEGTAVVSLEKSHLRLWDVTEEEVMEQALMNTPGQKRAWILIFSEVSYGREFEQGKDILWKIRKVSLIRSEIFWRRER